MDASCQCGNLTAHIADGADPMVVLCHCVDCQKRTGSAFGQIAYFPAEQVEVAGEAREFSRPTDEGNLFTSGFCPTCGSTLYARTSKLPGVVGVTIGTLHDPGSLAPAISFYESRRHGWIELPDSLPGFAQGRSSNSTR